MNFKVPVIDETGFPVGLGPVSGPAKTPSSGWRNWFNYTDEDIPEIYRLGEAGYASEWGRTTDQGQKDIGAAAVNAGLSHLNADMNRIGGAVAARAAKHIFIKENPAWLHVLDVCAGSGNTTVAMYEAMQRELTPEQLKATKFTLTDLSRSALLGDAVDGNGVPLTAEGKLKRLGVEFDAVVGPDVDVLPTLDRKFDLLRENAGIHHHGYKPPAFKARYDVTAPDSLYVCTDWHNSMWYHPGNILHLLKQFPKSMWPGKEAGIKRFIEAYPAAEAGYQKPWNPFEARANEDIIRFWLCYGGVKKTPDNNFFIEEGHEPADVYTEYMRGAGYKTKTSLIGVLMRSNPWYMLPGSDIGAVTIGQK